MKKYIFLVSLVSIIAVYIFVNGKIKKNNQKIIAKIDNIEIKYDVIDKRIEQKLYDILYQIYLMRKEQVKQVIANKLIELEAEKKGIKVSEFLKSCIEVKINPVNLTNFVIENHFDKNGISDINDPFNYYEINSIIGKKILHQRYREILIKNLVDSLYSQYEIEIYLNAPEFPRVHIDDNIVHFRGNLNSKVTLIEISDFECQICRDYHPIYNKIYQKYKDKIRYGYINFSAVVNASALISEYAAEQGKFWEVYELLFDNEKGVINETNLIDFAEQANFNINDLYYTINDSILIENIDGNHKSLSEKGLYGTPTLLINGKLIQNNFSETHIDSLINHELKKLNK